MPAASKAMKATQATTAMKRPAAPPPMKAMKKPAATKAMTVLKVKKEKKDAASSPSAAVPPEPLPGTKAMSLQEELFGVSMSESEDSFHIQVDNPTTGHSFGLMVEPSTTVMRVKLSISEFMYNETGTMTDALTFVVWFGTTIIMKDTTLAQNLVGEGAELIFEEAGLAEEESTEEEV